EQHSRRRADRPRERGAIERAESAGAASPADARRSALGFAGLELRAAVALPAQPAGHGARRHLLSQVGRRAAAEPEARVRAVLREQRAEARSVGDGYARMVRAAVAGERV